MTYRTIDAATFGIWNSRPLIVLEMSEMGWTSGWPSSFGSDIGDGVARTYRMTTRVIDNRTDNDLQLIRYRADDGTVIDVLND